MHERYHVSAHLNEAVDSVRKEEHAQLSEQANEWLKGKKYLFLKSPESWRQEEKESFKELRQKDMKVTKAWGLKENFRHFWEFEERQTALTRNIFSTDLDAALFLAASQAPFNHRDGNSGKSMKRKILVAATLRMLRSDSSKWAALFEDFARMG